MPKIVFKTSQFPVLSETFVTNQVVAAIEMGYDVAILVSKKNESDSSAQAAIIKKYDLLNKTFEVKDQRPKNRIMVYFKALKLAKKRYPSKYLRLFNFFKYGRPGVSGRLFYDLITMHSFLDADIFHVQFGTYAEPLVTFKKGGFLNGKILTTFHGFDVFYAKSTLSKRKKEYKDLFSFGSYFTCNTPFAAGQLTKLGCPQAKLETVPMGVDTNFFKPLPKKKEAAVIRLLSVGTVIILKGHEYGIRAVAELVKKGHKILYTIIGEGEERKNLEQLIKELNLEDQVTLTGAKDQPFIRDALQQADIFLMTSTHDEEGRRETQGIVTAEAQSCGLPVCAFNSGGVPYTIVDGETGLLAAENDYVGMADNIEKLMTDTALRNEMSANARRFVTEKYSLEKMSANMQKIYQKLLETAI